MISVDTELLQQLANVMTAADGKIKEAGELLQRTTTHNDWCCRERNTINEKTQKNKELGERLCVNSRTFSSELTAIASEFLEREKSVSNMMGDVEGAIAGSIAVAVGILPAIDPEFEKIDLIEPVGIEDDTETVENDTEESNGIAGVFQPVDISDIFDRIIPGCPCPNPATNPDFIAKLVKQMIEENPNFWDNFPKYNPAAEIARGIQTVSLDDLDLSGSR